MNAAATVFGPPRRLAGLMTRLRWRLEGGAAAVACGAARRLVVRGDHLAAAAVLQAAQAAAPQDPRIALVTASLARFGLITGAAASEMLRGAAAADAPPHIRDAAALALMELLWERHGPTDEAVALARGVIGGAGAARPTQRLRAAALLDAAGAGDEAAEAAARLRTRAPGAVAATGHLEFVLSLLRRGWRGLRHAENARRAEDALAAGEGLFERLIAENPGDLALVANGPSLCGLGLGRVIDARRLVVRFNAPPDDPADHGRRIDVWMRPHDDRHVPLRAIPGLSLIVASGCDLRHRFADGAARMARLAALGAPVAVVPPELYRSLFLRLEAVPSIGLSGLAWAAQAAGGRLDASAAFGYCLHMNDLATSRYHDRIVTGFRPSRHNWRAEQSLFEGLLKEG